jgi:hypothetical protein
VKFNVQYELTLHDFARAVALEAEREEGTTLGRQIRISQLTKTEIKLIAREQVQREGEPDSWPEQSERGIYEYARQHCNDLWPKGV